MIDALFDLFGTYYQMGHLALAEGMARSIQLAIPDNVVSLQFLGLVYFRTGCGELAREAFRTAHREDDTVDQGAERDEREFADRHCGVEPRLQASSQCLRAASREGSPLAGAWYHLGLVLFRLRRYQPAISALQAAAAARPDCRATRRALARITRYSSPAGAPGDPELPAVSWVAATHASATHAGTTHDSGRRGARSACRWAASGAAGER